MKVLEKVNKLLHDFSNYADIVEKDIKSFLISVDETKNDLVGNKQISMAYIWAMREIKDPETNAIIPEKLFDLDTVNRIHNIINGTKKLSKMKECITVLQKDLSAAYSLKNGIMELLEDYSIFYDIEVILDQVWKMKLEYRNTVFLIELMLENFIAK